MSLLLEIIAEFISEAFDFRPIERSRKGFVQLCCVIALSAILTYGAVLLLTGEPVLGIILIIAPIAAFITFCILRKRFRKRKQR